MRIALAGLVLAVAQAPVAAYGQNQNTYLVRAVAATTAPALRSDRLVRSTDPTPVFTFAARVLVAAADGPLLLHAVWLLAAVAFFVALRSAVVEAGGGSSSLLLWTAGMAVVGGAGLDILDGTVLASPLDGVAGQYALGPVLQPSVAGVLLVVAAARAARHGLDRIAVLTLFAAALVHPSYLPAAWILLVAAGVAEASRRGSATAVLRPVVDGVVATVVVVLANVTSYVGSLDPAADEANRILAEERVPHHALPGTWLDARSMAVLGVVLVAAVLARRSVSPQQRWSGTFLLAGAALVVAATTLVWALGSPTLLLSFPWRASVCLVPLATSSLVARAVAAASARPSPTPQIAGSVAVALVVLAVVAGLDRTGETVEDGPGDGPLVVALRDARVTGEGVIPTGRTVMSHTQVVDDVRLNAGVPVYADWKNNPNEPAEVVAWRARLDEVDAAMADVDRLCELVSRRDLTWAALPPDLAEDAQGSCLAPWSTTEAGDLTLLVAPGHARTS